MDLILTYSGLDFICIHVGASSLCHFSSQSELYKGSAGVNHRNSSSSRWCWRGSQSRCAERCHLHVQTALRRALQVEGAVTVSRTSDSCSGVKVAAVSQARGSASLSENKWRQMNKGHVLYAGNYLGVTEMIVKKNVLKLCSTPPYGTITSVVAVIERLASNPRPSSLLCWCSKREKIFSGIPAHFIQSGERTP